MQSPFSSINDKLEEDIQNEFLCLEEIAPVDKVLEAIIKASGTTPIKLFTISCHGEGFHLHANKFCKQIPKGSKIMTVCKSNESSKFIDLCNKDMLKWLDSLAANNKEGVLTLEDVQEAYCLSQRFSKNTPAVSIFNGQSQKIIKLNDYFNENFLKKDLKKEDISISNRLKDLLKIKNISAEDLSDLVQDLNNSSDDPKQHKLFRMPKELSNVNKLVESYRKGELSDLFQSYSKYFVGDFNKVFDANDFNPHHQWMKDYETFEKGLHKEVRGYSEAFCKSICEYATPLMYTRASLFGNFNHDCYDKSNHVIPKHSLMLTLAFDCLRDNLDVNITGEEVHTESH